VQLFNKKKVTCFYFLYYFVHSTKLEITELPAIFEESLGAVFLDSEFGGLPDNLTYSFPQVLVHCMHALPY
jgi:hypothetical protein